MTNEQKSVLLRHPNQEMTDRFWSYYTYHKLLFLFSLYNNNEQTGKITMYIRVKISILVDGHVISFIGGYTLVDK